MCPHFVLNIRELLGWGRGGDFLTGAGPQLRSWIEDRCQIQRRAQQPAGSGVMQTRLVFIYEGQGRVNQGPLRA